jgi:hypothetical protein
MEPITAFGKLVVDSVRHHLFVSKAAAADSASHAALAPPPTTDSDVDDAYAEHWHAKIDAQMVQSECEELAMDTTARDHAKALSVEDLRRIAPTELALRLRLPTP